jgi:hypothetical protein
MLCHVERSPCQAVALCEGWRHLSTLIMKSERFFDFARNDKQS